MLVLDGSQGEGGGQILRTSLALSLHTGRAFRLEKLRAGRAKPGLLRQHLTAVRAATAVGDAEVQGAELGSRTLVFTPRAVRGGVHELSIGSAGSTLLVVQTVLPALLLGREPATLVVDGGTHNSAAPPFDFFDLAYLPLVRRMGADVRAELVRPGYYPAGGGRVRVRVEPVPALAPLTLEARGALRSRAVRATVSQVPMDVARREVSALCAALDWSGATTSTSLQEEDAAGPGNVLTAHLAYDGVAEVFTGFGERGVRAEQVARAVADEVTAYLAHDAPVGAHLADQLVLLLALAGSGSFRTGPLTEHTRTQLDVLSHFGFRVTATHEPGGTVRLAAG